MEGHSSTIKEDVENGGVWHDASTVDFDQAA